MKERFNNHHHAMRLFAFSDRGRTLALRIAQAMGVSLSSDPLVTRGALPSLTEAAFREARALVFVGATGIAVRAIAPHVRSKQTDPAVLCVDEGGRFVIPLLSGHLGGANDLAAEVASRIGATPVITTATDGRGLFSVDVFARDRGLVIADMEAAKDVSAALLRGARIPFYSELFYDAAALPPELEAEGDLAEIREGPAIAVTWREAQEARVPLCRLIPKRVAVGIGCRRGTEEGAVDFAVRTAFAVAGLDPRSICCAATVDLKKDEPGLRSWCGRAGLPLHIYTPEQLMEAEGDFAASAFVLETTGADNVCERAAALAAAGAYGGATRRLFGRTAQGGVTIAAYVHEAPL
ncbi:MAG: cobalamin biosynthesis protein [Clostridiales Family XIII bacterium]|jgi:cobalt-precorrin 5A hydrolase|nr:cobalamin biosynthesis protein [Clostridiales Family XIII bacterium]